MVEHRNRREISSMTNLVISSLAMDFECINYVTVKSDKKDDVTRTFRVSKYLLRNIPQWKEEPNFHKLLNLISEKVVEEDRKVFISKTRREVIIEQLKKAPAYYILVKVDFDDEITYIQIKFSGDWTHEGELKGFVFGLSKLQESRRKEMERYEAVEKIIDIQTEELRKKNLQLHKVNEKIVALLGDIVEGRDPDVGQHINRVKRYTYALAMQVMKDYPEYRLTESKINIITYVSPLHDIGKIVIPDSILLKPGELTADEWEVMKTHCDRGCEMLKTMAGTWGDDYMNISTEICKYHHEKWDGNGYPLGLKGDNIPISAQIVAVADCFDALTSNRAYKEAVDARTAIKMILEGECGKFSDKIRSCLSKCSYPFAMAMASNTDFNVIRDKSFSEADNRKRMFKNMSILLIDCDDISREVSREILESEGAIVTEALNGYEGASITERTDWFDMIIMDLEMPGMSGLETIRAIREMPQVAETEIPIVTLSAEVTDEDIEEVKKAGGLGCLTKPLLMSELYEAFLSSLKDKTSKIEKKLEDTIRIAKTDALTKVKNITAYTDKVAELAKTISENEFTEFGIILCDINDLKKENDTYGHDIGDIYIMNCCRVICAVFGHSPVFRIGGDEFAVVLQGEDYRERDNLMRQMDDMVNTLSKISSSELGKASFASGMAVYDPAVDESVSDVIRRADTKMYENKNRIKDGE